ncbi:prolyl oligopeptidase family serine peptidase [Brachybacterium muris]|uniref:S9 family peptidase n=1 Tax=Brachybacterium muris TaxID=219301 RepID=UPI00223A9918|nr:prolyl oligopeptidase family serine peptidase [Brachybacterium muris]
MTDTSPETVPADAPSIFHDLRAFVAEPRITGLFLSPAGDRLVAARTELNKKKNGYVTALWELPHTARATRGHRSAPSQGTGPRRLTRGVDGEALAGFTAHGDLLFTAKRDTGDEEDKDETTLFLLPRGGGEAFKVARRHGGFTSLSIARDSGRIALTSGVHPHAADDADDRAIAAERRETKTSAILHTGHPVRYWDHDLGPARDQVFVAEPLDPADPHPELELRRLTSFGPAERLGDVLISPDGSVVYAQVTVTLHGTTARTRVLAIDVASGDARTLAAEDDHNLGLAGLSPDGTVLLLSRSTVASDRTPLAMALMKVDLETGELAPSTTGFSNWPADVRITPDSTAAYFTADREGHGAIHRLDLASGEVTVLTDDRNHYSALHLDERTGQLVALADAIDAPPLPVGCDPVTGETTPIPCGIEAPEVPGTLTEVTTTAEDGTPLRAWLCLPETASAEDPAPLLLWIHGGPFGSWNAWTWRWNPWTATARGYAVLLPDPAISTGYGQEMIDRGWDQLGGSPYDDIMRLTHTTLDREDIDAERKAALGGSYGGYMANWIAGHTGDFFDCIVTHASLWALDQFRGTTDAASHWNAHLSDEHNAKYNPADGTCEITAPMLVIHGDKDYRVPIGEGLRLWFELLTSADQDPAQNPHRFLYFPDENHWILSPNNSVIWYETVYAFVDRHVRGIEAEMPRLLG